MAFWDMPLIDPPSVNSERSERETRKYLNQGTGFVCRPDHPDKGCDLDVELAQGRGAANRRFGIQLKSVETLPLLADGQTISYSFETSRLGYLLNRPVGEGLFILYDVAGDRLYYEYAVTIYQRLMEQRGSDDWQERDTVNIHIPINNVLNETAATEIHTHFCDRFEKVAGLLASQGGRYGIAVAATSTDIDIHNPEHVRRVLLDHGLGLLQGHDLELCFNLLRALPVGDLDLYPEFMVLAAIAYSEMGRFYDSEHFIKRLYKRNTVPEAQRQMVAFCHSKNQLLLNEITIAEFLSGAKEMRATETSALNQVLLDLNILYYELMSVPFYHGLPPDTLQRIRSVSQNARALTIDERSKQLIIGQNAENLAQYVNFVRMTYFNDLALHRITRQLGAPPALTHARVHFSAVSLELNDILEKLFQEGQTTNDALLQGHALLIRARYLKAQEFDLYGQLPTLKYLRFHDQAGFTHNIALCIHGANLFLEAGYPDQAHHSLFCGIELIQIGRLRYEYKDEFDLDDLKNWLKELEEKYELEPGEFQFPKLVERLQKLHDEREVNYMSDTRDMDDLQLKGMAAQLARVFRLSASSLPNVLKELEQCRLFYQRRNEDLELLPYDRSFDRRVTYRGAARFVIRNKRTDIRSIPSSDVGALLNSWGM